MSLRTRLARLDKRLASTRTPAGPLTLFLLEATPERPAGQRVVWEGAGRVIVYDPAMELPELPPGGPHKLLLGCDPDWL